MIAFDFETFLIRPGLQAPPPVCFTWSCGVVHGIRHARDLTEEWLRDLLFDHRRDIVGANLAFDMAVLGAAFPGLIPDIFQAYEQGRCWDVQINQKLLDLAEGNLQKEGYSLADLEKRHLGIDRSADKTGADAWRFRYHELYHVPVEKWPEDARRYALDDAVGAARIFALQGEVTDGQAQAAAAWALYLTSAWGLRTDEQGIKDFQRITEARYDEITKILQDAGLVRANGSRDTKAAAARMISVCEEAGLPIPRTDGYLEKEKEGIDQPYDSGVSLNAEACDESGDELLEIYAERTSLHTVVTTHIPALYRGVDSVIQPRFNVLVETGRTSCSGADSGRKRPKTWCGKQEPAKDCIPRSEEDRFCRVCGEMLPASYGYQVQNVRRLPGIREAFIARPGTTYILTDFSGLELCTVAQVCKVLLGYSHLGDAINAGLDPHLDVAAQILGISYEEAHHRLLQGDPEVKEARQIAKALNFGLPGGLGARTFLAFARGYGVRLTLTEAESLRNLWFRKYLEFPDYFRHINRLLNEGKDGLADIVQLFSGRVRGKVYYTAACNTFFQGLGADVAKKAHFAVAKACYAEPKSVLYGTRPVNFVHDEIISETATATAHEAAFEQARVMVEAANEYLPDVPVKCTPALSTRWTKDAEAVFLDGKLVPWDLARAGKWPVTNIAGEAVRWRT